MVSTLLQILAFIFLTTETNGKLRPIVGRAASLNDEPLDCKSILLDDNNNNNRIVTQIHLAYGHDPSTEMTVSYSTPFSCGNETMSTAVLYWKQEGEEQQYFISDYSDEEVKQYNTTSCVYDDIESHFYISPYIHHVRLKNLEPATIYNYRVVNAFSNIDDDDVLRNSKLRQLVFHNLKLLDNGESITKQRRLVLRSNTFPLLGLSHTYSLKTAPSKGEEKEVYKFGVIADHGQTERSQAVQASIMRDGDKEAVILAGDISYANSYYSLWDSWFDEKQPLISKIPLMVAPGNHEIENDNFTHSIFLSYENRFACPKVREAQSLAEELESGHCSHPSEFIGTYDYGNSFYSWAAGLSTFMVLNPYTSIEFSSPQYNFVIDTLESIDRSVTPWLFVVIHCPWYNTFNSHQNETPTNRMRDMLEPIFVEYKVNIIFTGHTHGYSRSKPVAFDTVDENGTSPIYITIGDGGERKEPEAYNSTTPEEWVASRDGSSFSYGTVSILNGTHASFTRKSGINFTVYENVFIENQIHL